jgi:hypothetical protein
MKKHLFRAIATLFSALSFRLQIIFKEFKFERRNRAGQKNVLGNFPFSTSRVGSLLGTEIPLFGGRALSRCHDNKGSQRADTTRMPFMRCVKKMKIKAKCFGL